jgi:hypothetical protein
MHKTFFLRIMFTMKKAITTVHTIIVILGLLATAGWSSYYLYNQRQFNSVNNTSRIPTLVKDVSSSLQSSQALYDKEFGNDIKRIFTENQDIVALSVYSYDTGIEYFYSRNGQVSIVNKIDELSQNPKYKGLSFSNSIGSMPLSLKDKPGTNIDIIFTVLPRTSIFYVLKISLLAVIILFVITLILIVAFSLSRTKGQDESLSDWEQEETDQEVSQDSSDLEDDSFSDDVFDKYDNDLSADQDLSLPGGDFNNDSDFSMDDDFGLDELDKDQKDDMDFDIQDDFSTDDMNLEDSIPDIPDSEDLMGMDHEEMPMDDGDDSDDDFSFPEEESLFDEMSSDDLDLEDNSFDSSETDQAAPSLYNPDTGLGWESFLEERLGLELERSASFDQDLVLMMIKNESDNSSDMDKILKIIKEVYTYHDLIFEAGKDSLALIEPNKDLDEAIIDVQSLFKRMEQEMDISSLNCGLSSRNGRLITGKRLIKEADTSLNKSDDENPIVGFRSDPEKFREFLNHSS